MDKKTWSLYEAKNRFSALVEASRAGEAQYVTRRGKRACVVVSVEEFERMPLQPRDIEL